MKTLVIKESQYRKLQEMLQVHEGFLEEMNTLKGRLMEGNLMEDNLIDDLSGKFRGLLQKSGLAGLRYAVSAALIGGSLAGVSTDAIAQAAIKAGVSEPQAKEISMQSATKGYSTQAQESDYAKQLKLLNKRYVVANNDPSKTKNFMNFVGDMKDVVGIEPKYGYPIFAKGSKSEQLLNSAFENPNVLTGIVNVSGKDLPGRFVKSQGLWYTITTPPVPPVKIDPVPSTNVAPEAAPAKLIDFSGTIKQAYLAWQQATSSGQTKDEAPVYIARFFRERIKGFEDMSDAQIGGLFKNGTKISVDKIGKNVSSDITNLKN